MMDEYIPSPRLTPNKPRRLRDVSTIYPVNEKQLLLEAIMKQQRESLAADGSLGAAPPQAAAVDHPDPDTPHPAAPPALGAAWPDKRICPVCNWPGGSSSSSSSSGTSECEGGDSDTSSGCKDCNGSYKLNAAGSSSSSSEDEDDAEDKEVHAKAESPDNGGVEEREMKGNDALGEAQVDSSPFKKEEEQKLQEPTTHFFAEKEYDSLSKSVGFRKPLNGGHCLLGREVLTAPGKLLYGRHSVYYRGTTIYRPQGRN